jgi:glycerophosphoryl diester phosphodiesterase
MNFILHRGDISISQENTFESLLNNNYNIIELDIIMNNNNIYVIHDNNLNRLCNTNLDLLNDINLKNIKIQKNIHYENKILNYNSEKNIPIFEDLLKKINEKNKKICIDFKNYDINYLKNCKMINKFFKLVNYYSNAIMYICCFNDTVLKYIYDNCKNINYGIFMYDNLENTINYTNAKYLIYEKNTKIINHSNKKIIIYTLNKNDNLKNYNCDYIIFDNI